MFNRLEQYLQRCEGKPVAAGPKSNGGLKSWLGGAAMVALAGVILLTFDVKPPEPPVVPKVGDRIYFDKNTKACTQSQAVAFSGGAETYFALRERFCTTSVGANSFVRPALGASSTPTTTSMSTTVMRAAGFQATVSPSSQKGFDMPKPDDDYGLLIECVNNYGTDYVEVRVVRREPGGEAPLGCPSDGEAFLGYGCPKHLIGLALDGLGMYGFVSDSSDSAFIAHDVEFRNVYASDERKLARMLKAIKRVNARIEKDRARDPGDKFASFAKALKLSFAVCRIGERRPNPEWRFMPIAEGRNYYRQMIEASSAEVLARKVA
ncbi:hypothetical protein GWG65_34920 [Bradyrhizobium sp. CSA207]|uniref:hypothetical protein n=1 Tax=Bradyrhizobium sp. CSA207 TaxID=2698826 RepID=UPI0023AF5B6F|nr:hypothetical protein [Bradyrhizobium sp. CSA207]MDE5446466.1 hypothetical protein [Bradyrhizobium sp. CSA207]